MMLKITTHTLIQYLWRHSQKEQTERTNCLPLGKDKLFVPQKGQIVCPSKGQPVCPSKEAKCLSPKGASNLSLQKTTTTTCPSFKNEQAVCFDIHNAALSLGYRRFSTGTMQHLVTQTAGLQFKGQLL